MAVTMHDVAARAGVSFKTVSNVINDHPHIRPDTKRRVLDAIEALGYRPNLSARGLRSGRTGVISLIIPDIRHSYFAELAAVVMRAAEKRGVSVIIEQSDGDPAKELALLRGSGSPLVDGILYSVLGLGHADAHLLADVTTPLVLLGERIFNGPTDHVTMQNTEATRAATAYLISLGHTRIVAFGAHRDEDVGSSALRLQGYREALAEAGLPYDERLVVEIGDWFRAQGAQSMRELLHSGVEFDAIVAFNDLLALGAMSALQDARVRVPEDVSIIGFDDLDETRYSQPKLSTIDPGRAEIAETAVDYLLERVGGAEAAALPPREYLSRFQLIPRESTAPRHSLPVDAT